MQYTMKFLSSENGEQKIANDLIKEATNKSGC